MNLKSKLQELTLKHQMDLCLFKTHFVSTLRMYGGRVPGLEIEIKKISLAVCCSGESATNARLHVKGAGEIVLDHCTHVLYPEGIEKVSETSLRSVSSNLSIWIHCTE